MQRVSADGEGTESESLSERISQRSENDFLSD